MNDEKSLNTETPPNRATPRRLIIDTDPGVDDAIAILLALAAPDTEVLGLTAVGGNVPLARGARNALALLQAAHRADLPVARGAARPRTGRYHPSIKFHGPGGLSLRLPNPTATTIPQTAADFLHEKLTAQPGQITIAALGPLTNLSRLEQHHPGALRQAAGIAIMGGAVNAPGNVTPQAEFNIHSDPLSASHIFESGNPIALADLAASRQVYVTRQQAAAISAHTRIGQLSLQILQGWFHRDPQRQRFEFYDPLAVAMVLDPAVATVRRVTLQTGTAPGEHWGETTIAGEPGPVALADQVDAPRFFALLRSTLGWHGI